MTKIKPPTQSNEVAIKVNIDLPDALFTKPAMEITLSAPEPQGVELSTEVQDQISEFIAEATGLKTVVRFEAAECTLIQPINWFCLGTAVASQ
jgi:hypothetical protein